ncbi:MAG: hypothetical protein RMX96_12395 [Nostoc sp. ChiSLP02]|nr:hypothetical protein [Nostoc sp. DedSLP05]MDZ8103379.1 hypothetical protein [Nostoc sp. DedSLP01]MDZ8185642.1 hypothetical protein [Nostoc sp. ChiSLP02]
MSDFKTLARPDWRLVLDNWLMGENWFGKQLGDRLFRLTVSVVLVKICDRYPTILQILTSCLVG